MDLIKARHAAAKKAAERIESGMIVGLGSGRTSELFIEELGNLIERGLKVQAVPSSRASAELAKKKKIPLLDINSASHIDVTVDGADEIDPKKRMIKGGGGALLREKILAAASREVIIIIDEAKRVPLLGKGKLPLEILFYGSPYTRAKIENLGFRGHWRMDSNGTNFITENGNLIYDIEFDTPLHAPEKVNEVLLHIPGVIETGFFFNMAHHVIVGFSDAHVEILH